ncbi:MAG: hypothetical protein JSU86_07855, partial [Phycisphaerales bacterium]
MRIMQGLKQGVQARCAVGTIMCCLWTSSVLGADPEIHAAWQEPGEPPELDRDYKVMTTSPASVDFPDVELITGSLTWQIWSTDTDNPDNIGDIGVISSPHAQNFGVEIEKPGEIAGAREVKGINLDPQGEGSDANYSNLTGGSISGNLSGDLFVQESSGESGGSVSFTVDGNVQGDIGAATISALSIGGHLSGDVEVEDVTGTMSVTGDFLSASHLFAADDISGSLSIGGNAYGDLDLDEFTGSLSVAGDVDFEWLTIWSSGSGDITGGAVSGSVTLAAGNGNAYSGTATFSSVASGAVVQTWLASVSGTIHV